MKDGNHFKRVVEHDTSNRRLGWQWMQVVQHRENVTEVACLRIFLYILISRVFLLTAACFE